MIRSAAEEFRQKQVFIHCKPSLEKIQRYVEASKVMKVARSSAREYNKQKL